AATSGEPRRTTRSPATARAMPSPSGETQRLNSSTSTRLAATLTTNSGWSTDAGIVTGPTITEACAAGELSAVAGESSEQKREGAVLQPAIVAMNAIEIRWTLRCDITSPLLACRE